ncbi:MAG: hypothetical protein AB1650_07680, partial [Candidatus Omnitrophota bacterium]
SVLTPAPDSKIIFSSRRRRRCFCAYQMQNFYQLVVVEKNFLNRSSGLDFSGGGMAFIQFFVFDSLVTCNL